jgi:hypothetical protein
VRDVQNGADHLALLSRCRKINGHSLAEAARLAAEDPGAVSKAG